LNGGRQTNKTKVLQEFAKRCLPYKRRFKTKKAQENELWSFGRKAESFKNELRELNARLKRNRQYEIIYRHWEPGGGPSRNYHTGKESHDAKPNRFMVNLAQRRYPLEAIFIKKLGRDFWGSEHHLIVVESRVAKPVEGNCSLCGERGVKTMAFVKATLHWTGDDWNDHEKPIRACAYHALSRIKRYEILKKTREYASKGYGEYYSNDLENIRTFVPASIPPWETIRAEALASAPELRDLFGDQGSRWVEVSEPLSCLTPRE
jgi:hypothetical protein